MLYGILVFALLIGAGAWADLGLLLVGAAVCGVVTFAIVTLCDLDDDTEQDDR